MAAIETVSARPVAQSGLDATAQLSEAYSSGMTLLAGTPQATVRVDLGNPRPQSPLGRLTGGLLELAQPENSVARFVAERDFGLHVGADGRTLSLPNTREGGQIFADIQNTQVGYAGNNIDHSGFLKVPEGVSPEFVAGYNERAREHGLQGLVEVGSILAYGLLPALGARSRIQPAADPLRISSERVIERTLGLKAGSELASGVGWRQRGETPQPWNAASQAKPLPFDCNWCSLEVLTGQKREALRPFVSPEIGLDEAMTVPKLGNALRKLGLLDGKPAQIRIQGTQAEVTQKLLEYPPGKTFAITLSNNPVGVNTGNTGHTVVGIRTSHGIEIYDGQVNKAYDLNRVRTVSVYAYPINRPLNPALLP